MSVMDEVYFQLFFNKLSNNLKLEKQFCQQYLLNDLRRVVELASLTIVFTRKKHNNIRLNDESFYEWINGCNVQFCHFVPKLGKLSWSIQANECRETFKVKVTKKKKKKKKMGLIASYIV